MRNRLLSVCFILYIVSLATTMSGMEIFSSLLLFGVLLSLIFAPPEGFKWSLPPYGGPIFGFLLIACIGIFLGDAPRPQKLYDLGRLRFFFAYFALYYYLRWFSAPSWIKPLAVVCSIIALYGFLQHFIPMDLVRPVGKKVIMYSIPEGQIGPLVLGTFNHHLTFASIYLSYACLFCALGIFRKPRSPGLLFLGAVLFLLCLWTQSRTAWIAVPICVAFLFYPLGKRKSALVTTGVIVLLSFFLLRDRGFVERFQRTFSTVDAYTLAPRTRLWDLQWDFFKQAPLIGVGWNNNERSCAQYFAKRYPVGTPNFCGHAHSNVLQILSTTGALGLIYYLALWAFVFARLVGTYRQAAPGSMEKGLSWGLLVAFLGFHIQGLTQWNFGDAEVLHNVILLGRVSNLTFESEA